MTFAPEGVQPLTVPAHKPIKPVYVRRFVAMVDAVVSRQDGDED